MISKQIKRKLLSVLVASDNICHIPKYHKPTYCLYAGSARTGLHLRFKSHLGYGHKSTGAVFLRQTLIGIPPKDLF